MHTWLKSYGDFAEYVGFGYCWSCIGKVRLHIFFLNTHIKKCQILKSYMLVGHIFLKTSKLHYHVIVSIQMQTDEDIRNTKFW